jgi:biotin operon repressor
VYRRGEIGQVARALRVLDALRGYKLGRWVGEIAAEVGASERTVRRDITELQNAGFDIEIGKRENRTIATSPASGTTRPSRSPSASASRCSRYGASSTCCEARRCTTT